MSSIPTPSSTATTLVTAESGHTLDVDRHGGTEVPSEGVPRPKLGLSFELDAGVVEGMFMLPGGRLSRCRMWLLTQFGVHDSAANCRNSGSGGTKLWHVSLGTDC